MLQYFKTKINKVVLALKLFTLELIMHVGWMKLVFNKHEVLVSTVII